MNGTSGMNDTAPAPVSEADAARLSALILMKLASGDIDRAD